MEDQGHADHKILAVPRRRSAVGDERQDLDDVPAHLLREFEHFFAVYKDLEDKKTATLGWSGVDEAHEVIERAVAAAG